MIHILTIFCAVMLAIGGIANLMSARASARRSKRMADLLAQRGAAR